MRRYLLSVLAVVSVPVVFVGAAGLYLAIEAAVGAEKAWRILR